MAQSTRRGPSPGIGAPNRHSTRIERRSDKRSHTSAPREPSRSSGRRPAMANRNDLRTDSDWEHFARTDPYWAVLTCDQYRRANLDGGGRAAFFESGAEHIGWVERTLRKHFDPDFAPQRALDFGCGVGRLLLPL